MNLSIFTKIELITQINELTDKYKKLQSEVEYMRKRTDEFQQKIKEHEYTEEGFKKIILEQAENIDDTVQFKNDLKEEFADKYVDMELNLNEKNEELKSRLKDTSAENTYLEEKLHAIEQKYLQVTVYDHAL